MWFAVDEKPDTSANMRLPYGLGPTVLTSAAVRSELESPSGLASAADVGPISSGSEANFETMPPLARGQDGPLLPGHDVALGFEQRSESDQTIVPKFCDAQATDTVGTVVDLANRNAALTAIAGEKPNSDVSLENARQFETLLNVNIAVQEGAEQVWSDLLAYPTEQPAEHTVDAAGDAAAHALNGLNEVLTASEHGVSVYQSKHDTEINPDHQRFDLSEAASPTSLRAMMFFRRLTLMFRMTIRQRRRVRPIKSRWTSRSIFTMQLKVCRRQSPARWPLMQCKPN
jgi:hypothetical protein